MSFSFLSVLSFVFVPQRGDYPPTTTPSVLRSNSRFSDTGPPPPGLSEVKLEWQKDNLGRNEFMTEMLSVQIHELAYEI